MKAVRLGFLQMLVSMRRDMMLFAICVTPIFAGLFFRFGIPFLETVLTGWLHTPAILFPYYALIDILFALLSPAMFCFVSAMVSLEETDEKTAFYLFVTPLGKTGYLCARFGIPAVTAFLATVILLPVFHLTSLSPLAILLLTTGGTLQGIIIALLILTLSTNKLEGMTVSKLSTLTLFGTAMPFFIKSDIQFVLLPLPSFWIGKAVFENRFLYFLPAFAISVIWIWLLSKRYLRKM